MVTDAMVFLDTRLPMGRYRYINGFVWLIVFWYCYITSPLINVSILPVAISYVFFIGLEAGDLIWEYMNQQMHPLGIYLTSRSFLWNQTSPSLLHWIVSLIFKHPLSIELLLIICNIGVTYARLWEVSTTHLNLLIVPLVDLLLLLIAIDWGSYLSRCSSSILPFESLP